MIISAGIRLLGALIQGLSRATPQLTRTVTPDGTVWTYNYDPFGRRISKQRLAADGSIAEQVVFTWDDSVLVEQSSVDGRTFSWDHQGLQPLLQTESLSPGDETDRRFYSIVTDLIGTPTHLVDQAGDISWEGRSTVWGVPAEHDDSSRIPLKFPGQYADDETGWRYNYHRHYDPATARYTTPDPLGLRPSFNNYGYVHNPLTWIDPLGLASHAPKPKRKPEQITENYSDFNQARNRALDILGDIDPHNRVPYVGRLESAPTFGRVVGFETTVNGVKKRFRVDYDPNKGPHINVEIGRGKDAERWAVPWDGTESDALAQIDRLNR
jgi:RHS repeat-associated protein